MFSRCLKSTEEVGDFCIRGSFPKFRLGFPQVVAYMGGVTVLLLILHQLSVPLQPLFPMIDMRLKALSELS